MFNDCVRKPMGEITIFQHKGGYFDIERQEFIGGEVLGRETMKNMIVNSASILMAQRMANNVSGAVIMDKGIQYLAVGTSVGDGGTSTNPNVGDVTYIRLRNEIARTPVKSCTYLTSTGTTSSTPTNIVQYVFTFSEAQANGGIVEMGMFGGNAGANANTGLMFNYKAIAVWNKNSETELTITWKVTY